MSPMQIKLILHAYACPFPYGGQESAATVEHTYDELVALGLVEESPMLSVWQVTPMGECFVNAVTNLPLPEQKWVMPSAPRSNEKAT